MFLKILNHIIQRLGGVTINFKVLDRYNDFYFIADLDTTHHHIIEVGDELEIDEDYYCEDDELLIQYDYISLERWLDLKENEFK